jgi:hypothetical protein
MRRQKPEILDVNHKRLKEVADRAKQSLNPQDAELIERVFESYEYVAGLIQDKNMSIGRLQKMLFGAKTEKTQQVTGDPTTTSPESAKTADKAGEAQSEEADAEGEQNNGKPPLKGHGRNPAEAYRGAERIEVPHPSLGVGDACPACGKGTLYQQQPRVIVRITGQAPLSAKKYELERLRCGLCGEVFTAEFPQNAGMEKYDAKAGAMSGL